MSKKHSTRFYWQLFCKIIENLNCIFHRIFVLCQVCFFILCCSIQQSNGVRRSTIKALSKCLSMPKPSKSPRQVLDYILENHIITVPAAPGPDISQILQPQPRRTTRHVAVVKVTSKLSSAFCPFDYETDEKADRFPPVLVYAACKSQPRWPVAMVFPPVCPTAVTWQMFCL